MNGKYERVRKELENSNYTIAFCGTGMMKESGMPSMRAPEIAYEVEKKYGYSPEEIFSSAFYATRTETFFEYYRNEMLGKPLEPSRAFYALAELEKRGKLQCCITNNVYNLPGRAGCGNVINLHGIVEDNRCPHCGKKYDLLYVRNSRRIPLCRDCMTTVRPQVLLFGEMVDNQLMTRAVEQIEGADVLLVLGTTLNSGLCEGYVDYFKGKTLVLINSTEHYLDKAADLVIYEEVREALPKIVWPDAE